MVVVVGVQPWLFANVFDVDILWVDADAGKLCADVVFCGLDGLVAGIEPAWHR